VTPNVHGRVNDSFASWALCIRSGALWKRIHRISSAAVVKPHAQTPSVNLSGPFLTPLKSFPSHHCHPPSSRTLFVWIAPFAYLFDRTSCSSHHPRSFVIPRCCSSPVLNIPTSSITSLPLQISTRSDSLTSSKLAHLQANTAKRKRHRK
jgi:hypothetical protein